MVAPAKPTSAIIFLFNPSTEGIGNWYGGVFDPAFLRALSAADPDGLTQSVVLRGDALPSRLAEKIVGVSSSGNASGYTLSYDMELYSTIIWDIADSLAERWNTLDLNSFPKALGEKDVYCIAVPTLPRTLKEKVASGLHGSVGYLGAIEVDLGNPIHRKVFLDCLIDDAIVEHGQLIMELGWEGYKDTHFEGAENFKPNGERRVAYGELYGLKPAIPDMAHSERGIISAERYSGKRKFSLQERVAEALTRSSFDRKSQSHYDLQILPRNNDPLEADLPEAKFIQYLLDENHPKGGAKARFFREALGIGFADWRYLAAQLHDGLKHATLVEVEVKNWQQGFGVSFNAVIPIRGLNGKTIDIDSNWIMEPGKAPRLSTAVPARRKDIAQGQGRLPHIVPNDLVGDDRWAALYEMAVDTGTQAASQTVPTPMGIVGFGIEMEGMCGFSWIRIYDGRKGFARWALRAGHASRHYKSGVQIFAKTGSQSIDRARAYAMAFAAVLKQNGVDCEVEERLD